MDRTCCAGDIHKSKVSLWWFHLLDFSLFVPNSRRWCQHSAFWRNLVRKSGTKMIIHCTNFRQWKRRRREEAKCLRVRSCLLWVDLQGVEALVAGSQGRSMHSPCERCSRIAFFSSSSDWRYWWSSESSTFKRLTFAFRAKNNWFSGPVNDAFEFHQC